MNISKSVALIILMLRRDYILQSSRLDRITCRLKTYATDLKSGIGRVLLQMVEHEALKRQRWLLVSFLLICS